MKKSFVLFMVATMLVTTVFFTQNVKADELTVVDSGNDDTDVVVNCSNYIVYQGSSNYTLIVDLFAYSGELQSGDYIDLCAHKGSIRSHYMIQGSLEDIIFILKSSDFSSMDTGHLHSFLGFDINKIVYCSSDVYYDKDYPNEGFFQKTPLKVQNLIPTVGGMKAGEIVQAILTQKIYLIPLLITLVVALVGFRKALNLLFRVLKRA